MTEWKKLYIKKLARVVSFLSLFCIYASNSLHAKAAWTFLVYVQADNNLEPFAEYNIADMRTALINSSVNVLVQWDQPDNNRTWRYRIVRGGIIEDASLSTEMGINPAQELIDMTKWAKAKYDADRWCIVLWNHGYGVLDPARNVRVPPFFPLIYSPFSQAARGILFDDSQQTYATNQDLSYACQKIKTDVLKKNIDILGMDACLMAMLEVGYQVKDCVDYMVASEQTEPADGWDYSAILNTMCSKTCTSLEASKAIVNSYKGYYFNRINDYTMSVMQLNRIEAVKTSLQGVLAKIEQCRLKDPTRTRGAIRLARQSTASFDVTDYIDLYNWCVMIKNQFSRYKLKIIANKLVSLAFKKAIDALIPALNDLQSKLLLAVPSSVAGPFYRNVKGISIYYPQGSIHRSYALTTFAKKTNWMKFLQLYRFPTNINNK